jgi:hypothetical protein
LPPSDDGILKIARDDCRLHDRQQVLLVDVEDAIEPFHRHDHTATHGHRPTGVAGAGAADGERHTLVVAEARDGGDLRRVRGKKHQVGGMADLKRIDAVLRQRGCISADVLGADDPSERCDEVRIHASAQREVISAPSGPAAAGVDRLP